MAKKSYSERIKVTSTGKLLRRKKGLGHFKAKKKSKAIRDKRNMQRISGADRNSIQSRLDH